MVETMKAGSVVSLGLVSPRTLKESVGARDPMMMIYYECLKICLMMKCVCDIWR